jgi:hypothetical protein
MINENVSFQTVEYMQQRIEELSAENAAMREALRFYANTPCNMEFGVVNACPYDDGDIARKALGSATDIEAGEHLK